VDGGADDGSLAALCAQGARVASAEALVGALPAVARPFTVRGADSREIAPIAATWRKLSADTAGVPCRFLFFANADNAEEYAATITAPGEAVVRFVPEDGSLRAIPHRVEEGRVVIEHTFPRMGSLALFVADQAGLLRAEAPAADLSARTPLPADLFRGKWSLELLDPNALTLDTCDFWFDGELQAAKEHVSVIQWRALQRERPVEIKMRYEVQVAPGYTPEGEIFLVLEQPERTRVTVNGAAVSSEDRGCYRDTSFRKLDVSGKLRPGRNEIVLETRFEQSPEVYENLRRARVFEAEKNKLTYDSEIEAAYLVGHFGVSTPGTWEVLPRSATRYHGDFVIGPLPEKVTLGDLTPQGLPFFNGRVRLTRSVRLTAAESAGRSFRFSERMAHVLALKVNGQPAGEWLWRPYEADLEGLLKPGENTFELELTGGLRNLLGPHHLQEGESYGVGPASFFKEPNIWGNLPWNDAYCFVEFGIRV